jgi:hypothetical protein
MKYKINGQGEREETTDGDQHIGIPMILARLEDRIFRGLDKKRARFLQAPKVGADLSMVWPQFAHWMLVDPHAGVIQFAKTAPTRDAIQAVADLFCGWIAGVKPPREEWRRCRSNASAAAARTAYAADAAYYASAAAYAYGFAARKKFFVLASEKLLALMTAAPAEDAR